jgi:hypothetical protein
MQKAEAAFKQAGYTIRLSDPAYRTMMKGKPSLKNYRETYERNWIVQRCIDAKAYWTTREGFDTVLELGYGSGAEDIDPNDADAVKTFLRNEKYVKAKAYVDQVNRIVNLNERTRNVLIKNQIYGRAALLIQFENEGSPWASRPNALHSLDVASWTPTYDRNNWQFTGIKVAGASQPLKPEQLIYFTNTDLDDNYEGRSDIAGIYDEAQTDRRIIGEDLPEAVVT